MAIKRGFYPTLLLITVIVGIILAVTYQFREFSNWLWIALVFNALLAVASNLLASLFLKRGHSSFVNGYFLTMLFRLLMSLFFIVIYLLMSTLIDKFEVVLFILLYFIYTAFEIKFILANLRAHSEKDKNADNARK